MRFFLSLLIAFISFLSIAQNTTPSTISRLQFYGVALLPVDFEPNEISGIDYIGGDTFVIVADKSDRFFYKTILTYSDPNHIMIRIFDSLPLCGVFGSSPEAIRYFPPDKIAVSLEGESGIVQQKLATGTLASGISDMPLEFPNPFRYNTGTRLASMKNNKGIEALAFHNSGNGYWVMNEGWRHNEQHIRLQINDSIYTTNHYLNLARLDANRNMLNKYAYVPDTNYYVSEMLNLDDTHFLVSEVHWPGPGSPTDVNLYYINISNATNISSTSINRQVDKVLITQMRGNVPLLNDLNRVEAMCWGKTIDDCKTLVFITDNARKQTPGPIPPPQRTQVIIYKVIE